jgi:hypothetical protein
MKTVPNIPKCCGRTMRIELETATSYEAHCGDCGDVIYIKKEKSTKPTMLDD